MSPHLIRIDALRGIAILLVLQLHILACTGAYEYLHVPSTARQLLDAGSAGVDLFFILSAYLLTTNLLRQQDTPGVIPTFFMRRAFRILPMFLLLIFGGFTLEALWLKAGGSSDTWLWRGRYPLSTYLLFLQNWRFGLDAGFPGKFFAPTWSLAVEEHFYLLLPLLATRLTPRRFAFVAIAWILIATPIRAYLSLDFGKFAPATWTIARLDAFGWGVLIALAPTLWPDLAKRLKPRVAVGAGAYLFIVVVLFAPYLTPGGSDDNVLSTAMIDLVLALTTFGVVNYETEPLQSRAGTHALAWCGKRCYSLYLLHMPLLGLVFLGAGPNQPPTVDGFGSLGLVALTIGLTLSLADICYRRIETPFMDLAGRLTQRRRGLGGVAPLTAAE